MKRQSNPVLLQFIITVIPPQPPRRVRLASVFSQVKSPNNMHPLG